ncbi:MAG: cation:proton antiporter [Trueperaceae bacterium]|nr:MAG: cation:proton antiporter [Trueperaceae bacterium]
MQSYREVLIFLAGFIVIALASGQIGRFFTRLKLPLISGFLFTGLLVGPYVLGLVSEGAVSRLGFVDETALAFIAFAAGSELYLKELRSHFKSIFWVTVGNVIAIPALGSLTLFLLADFIPFMEPMSLPMRLAVALLAGTILVARSPSSAIAIVNELRAKGPLTQTSLGVTMIIDVVVIVLFAFHSSIVGALSTELRLNLSFVLLLIGELLLSFGIGYLLARTLEMILALDMHRLIKTILILLAGYGIFFLSSLIRELSHENLPFDVLLEPLLICMISGMWISNKSSHRTEFLKILQETGPPIYIAFFTLTGASLELNVLTQTWVIALTLFAIRLVGIFIGSFAGGVAAGDPMSQNRLGWMTYVTQAGVGLGLAKEVAVGFPDWGTAFATLIISLIILNQIIGPPLSKWAIRRVGEAHPRAETHGFDGLRNAIIFGLDRQAIVLARQLQAHEWQVKLVSTEPQAQEFSAKDVTVTVAPHLELETLEQIDTKHATAIVGLLDTDEENYRLCELIFEHFGIETVVVRLKDRANVERFRDLGVLIVDPSTATVRLLEQHIRSPSAASLLLGMAGNQDLIEVEVRDPILHGVTIRHLRLPLDTLILSVRRRGKVLISHGYTRLEIGDHVTVVGSTESLEEVMLRFDKSGSGLQSSNQTERSH